MEESNLFKKVGIIIRSSVDFFLLISLIIFNVEDPIIILLSYIFLLSLYVNIFYKSFQKVLPLLLVSLFFWFIINGYFILFGTLFNEDSEGRIVKQLFVFMQLFLVAYILYLNVVRKDVWFLTCSYISSISLLILLKFGFIEPFKYQIVGNFALVVIIMLDLFGGKTEIRTFLKIPLFYVALSSGSRQSLIALAFYIFTNLILKLNLRKILIISILFFAFQYFNFDLNFFSDNFEYIEALNLDSIGRFIIAMEGDNGSNEYRVESNKYFIENFNFFPRSYDYFSQSSYLEPHNYFIEIIFMKGYFLGVLETMLIAACSFFIFLKDKKTLVVLLPLCIPALVSSGFHAARFFLLFMFLLIINFKDRKASLL